MASACGEGEQICDGSDEVRFAFAAGHGPRELMTVFGATNGDSFITIDGHCRFWVYENSLRGLRTGVLGKGLASDLSSQLHIGRYASVQGFAPPICLDWGGESIWDGTTVLQGSCSEAEGPRVWREAFSRVRPLFAELNAVSTPAWERTSVLPLRDAERPDAIEPAAWTASFDLGSRAVSPEDYTNGLFLDDGALVDDRETTAVLAELRLAAIERSPTLDPSHEYIYPGLFVIDAQAREFEVLLRDEPPEAVVQAARFVLANP